MDTKATAGRSRKGNRRGPGPGYHRHAHAVHQRPPHRPDHRVAQPQRRSSIPKSNIRRPPRTPATIAAAKSKARSSRACRPRRRPCRPSRRSKPVHENPYARAAFRACSFSAVALAATAMVDPKLYLDDIKFLASPELRGRGTGSPELEKAATFIERDYRQFGDQARRQHLPAAVPGHHRRRPWQGEPLQVLRKRPHHHAPLPRRFCPLQFLADRQALRRRGLRRLRHHRPRISLRRLCGPRRQRQDRPRLCATSRRNRTPRASSKARPPRSTLSSPPRPPTPSSTVPSA